MLFCTRGRLLLLVTISSFCLLPSVAKAVGVTSGYNLLADGPVISVPSATLPGTGYQVDLDLTFDPAAGPMTKNFDTPRYVTGQPVSLIGSQPLPFLVTENFNLVGGRALVSDWHEQIVTPGWVWVTPGQSVPGFPNLFPEGQSLITRNAQSWPSTPIGGSSDPARIDVQFAPIPSGNILDVHKALMWVGVTGANDIWGDGPNETTITVLEYPTPEPSSIVLAGLGLVSLFVARRRGR
jgi:hypothetical protein